MRDAHNIIPIPVITCFVAASSDCQPSFPIFSQTPQPSDTHDAVSQPFSPCAVPLALALLALGLTGCRTINEKLADGLADYIPQWAGGLPADAPPRPGTARYDEFMQEREKKRLEPAAPGTEAAEVRAPSAGIY